MNTGVKLTIGLPVYNGDKYIETTLRSLRKQTFEDYTLIISDNASTDRTEEICRDYASADDRISYFRNATNLGAVRNWYRVFDLSASEYFASAAHDDIYAPEYMEKCLAVLGRDPSVVLCYSKTQVIDQDGNLLGPFGVDVNTCSPKAHERLRNVIVRDALCIQLYGVMRSNALKRTKVFTGYYGCDRNTLAELALLGALYELPDYLFFHRLYPEALGAVMNSGRSLDELNTLDPGTDWRYRNTFLTIYRNYFVSVARLVSAPAERVRCYRSLGQVITRKAMRRCSRMWRNGR
jgi:glycosyltransferase involved in cell wall biosynthesis